MATAHLEAALERLGQDPAAATEMMRDFDPERRGTMKFDQFVNMLARWGALGSVSGGDGPDPKVLEFLRILDEYRVKCESEGNYLEAERALKQLGALRKNEERRQLRALKARHEAEAHEVQVAHDMQFAEFNAAWDKYLSEYDQMAQLYIKEMTEKHAERLREYQEQLNKELLTRPPKPSRDLLEWRRREQLLAKQRKYSEAQKIKRIADRLEGEERDKLDEGRLGALRQKEFKFRQQQRNEMSALIKRIEGRRREHLKQRESDSKRLLQRNRNVLAVLESKHGLELSKKSSEIRLALQAPRARRPREREPIDVGLDATGASAGSAGGGGGGAASHGHASAYASSAAPAGATDSPGTYRRGPNPDGLRADFDAMGRDLERSVGHAGAGGAAASGGGGLFRPGAPGGPSSSIASSAAAARHY